MRRLRGFGDTNFALLTQSEDVGGVAATPLSEAMFSLDVQGQTERCWRVEHFEVTEGLSTLYEGVLDVASQSFAENPDMMLGRYALLQVQRDAVLRRFYGVVRRVEQRGTTGTDRLARIYLVPALWALSQRSDCRVFQDMTAVEVVQAVLHEAGLYLGMLQLQLQRVYPRREYCVQYRETDLAFVMRLLESEGIAFFFRHEEDGIEVLVLSDGAHAWTPVPTLDGGPIPVAGPEMNTHRAEAVRRLTWEREQRPTRVSVREFDFTRPDFKIEGVAPRSRGEGDGVRAQYEPTPALSFGRYVGTTYTDEDAREQAQLRYEAELLPGAVGHGEGLVVGMAPGRSFALVLAGGHVPDQQYAVVRVEHVGDAREELVLASERDALREDRYHNRFQCILLEAPFRPARATPRPTIAGLQTAIVTGPAGEEVYTDEHGRVRVQFHWDRRGASNERSSCWLRAMQGPWSGTGWGFQFVPRVGMEVAVSFLDGDPDRPVVVGALYNGSHNTPFPLPASRTRSGVRTQSIGGAGNNELSFEDLADREQIFLRAQRDLDEVVLHDHTLHVEHDETVQVRGMQTQVVGGHQQERVVGDQVLVVESNRRERVVRDRAAQVEGNDHLTVAGNADRLFVHDVTTRVGGAARCEVVGARDESVLDDRTLRVRGHNTTVVGRNEAPRSSLLHVEGTSSFWSSRTTEIESEKDVLLRCGRSLLRLTPTRIELVSPEVIVRGGENRVTVGGEKVAIRAKREAVVGAEKVTVKSAGAAVKLGDDATVMGAKVKLDRGSLSLDSDPDDPVKVTTIELKDDDGNPIPHQRFVVLMGDGSEQTGIVNHAGRAIVELDEDAEIVFPDLRDVSKT